MIRTVAFLDILGFRKMIEGRSLAELAEDYERVFDWVHQYTRALFRSDLFPDHETGDSWCDIHIFSDSIVLISIDDSRESAFKLMLVSWRIQQMMLATGFAVRGGIATGELYMNRDKHIFLGQALTLAYELENRQDWVGVSIDNSVWGKYSRLNADENSLSAAMSLILKEYDVPMKGCDNESLVTLNWRFSFVVEKGTQSLYSSDGSEAVERKIKNTLDYAKFIVESGKVHLADPENGPVDLQTFFVGGLEPPFSHGDEY